MPCWRGFPRDLGVGATRASAATLAASRLRYRTQWLKLCVRDDELQIASEPEGEGVVIIELAVRRHAIEPGFEHTIRIRS